MDFNAEEFENYWRHLAIEDDFNRLTTEAFFLIHVNYHFDQPGKGLIPTEVAVCEWDLKNGITRTWHSLIDPGLKVIPTGYDSVMQEWRDKAHNIDLVTQEMEPRTKIEVFNHLVNFLKMTDEDRYPPPVFAQQYIVENIVQELSQEASSQMFFRVFPLAKLFFKLQNACAEITNGNRFLFEADAVVELDKDEYQQRTSLACEYHVKADAVAFCSLSHVKRWAYCVLQRCCHDAGIEMVRGRHHPEASEVFTIKDTDNVGDRLDSAMISQNADIANFRDAYERLASDHLLLKQEVRDIREEIKKIEQLEEVTNSLKVEMKNLESKFEKDLDVLVKANEAKDQELKILRNQIAEKDDHDSSTARPTKEPMNPRTSYNYFVQNYSKIHQNEKLSFRQLSKICAKTWKAMPREEKQQYINLAEQDRERYEKEMEAFRKNTSKGGRAEEEEGSEKN